jgi:hypothetical protein
MVLPQHLKDFFMTHSLGLLVPYPPRLAKLLVLVACSLMLCPLCFAQQSGAPNAAATAAEATGGVTATAPTKILAIGRLTTNASGAALKPILPSEVRETVRLYLAGKIEQWYFKPDDSAVVFILNLTDIKEAHDLLAQLPLGRAGFMEFELIRLAPLQPLGMLLSKQTR